MQMLLFHCDERLSNLSVLYSCETHFARETRAASPVNGPWP
jgi:hypothetical protein